METFKDLGMINSTVLCSYILKNFGPLSHLKLQKLLFYTEALHLAYFDKSLVEDEFEAWAHGPVSRKIYDEIKGESILHKEIHYKDRGGVSPEHEIEQNLTGDQVDLIKEILSEYSKLTAIQLEELSHSEKPWLTARVGYSDGDRCDTIIDRALMASYYKSELYGG